jgi:1-acyl-sn-glycerol-3-phosphate acyltransferase
MVVTVDNINETFSGSNLIISNHISSTDWFPLMYFSSLFGHHGDIRFVVKEEIKYLPIRKFYKIKKIVGWAGKNKKLIKTKSIFT